MSNIIRPGRCLGLLALVLAGACTDSASPLLPSPEGAEAEMPLVTCTANVKAGTLECVTAQPAASNLGLHLNRIVGGQERLVKLTSANLAYTAADSTFSVNVTIQNLMRSALGTPDGSTVAGIRVFFHNGPSVTSGTGTVVVRNPDGNDVFLSDPADYFAYAEILQPYQISGSRAWKFTVDPTVATFNFKVYVSAPLTNELTLLDAQWTGSAGTDWFTGANWASNAVPGASSVVAVPADSLLPSHTQPQLTANASISALRVGFGSTLNLGGFALDVGGNVDAPGALTGGTLTMSGTDALLSGTVNVLRVTGSTRLQGAVKATGAVSVQDGSLTVADRALSIQIP